jgi:RND family efflux transporter MFP subunit
MKRPQLAAVLTVALTLSSCQEEPPPPAEVIRPVRTQKVIAVGGGKVRRFSGVTKAGQESRLSFKVSGTVRVLRVKVGDRVKRGQLIAEIDPKDLRLAVQQAQAAYGQARAQVINAKAAYERTRKLYETQSAAKSSLDAARAAFESAQAAAASAAKQIQMARSQLAYARLTAPTDGVIAKCEAEVNENVTPGKTVVVMQSEGVPEVQVTVPEVFIALIKQGEKARVTLDAVKGRTFDATVSEVGVSSGAIGTAYPVTLKLEGAPADIRPGMAAEAVFKLGDTGGKERFLVPPVAVGQDRKGRYVFIAAPSDREGLAVVKRRAVEVGELTSRGLEVTRGLRDGELLITAGVSQIRDGLKVKLLTGGAGEEVKR